MSDNITKVTLKNGKVRWRARAKFNGKETSETFDFKKEAEAWKRGIEHTKLTKRSVNHELLTTTVDEIIDWAETTASAREFKDSTKRNFPRIKSILGKAQLAQLNQKTVNEFVNKLENSTVKKTGKKIASDTFRRAYYAFKVLMEKWAHHNDYGLEFIFNHELPPAWSNVNDRRITDQELEKLKLTVSSALNTRKDIWPKLMDFLTCTGLRLQELQRAEFSDISKEGVLTVWANNTKTKKDRHIPLTEDALEVISKLPRTQRRLFDFPSTQSIENQFKIIRREAGLLDITLHIFRHEFTSRLVERTPLSHAQIMALTGHKTLRTYQRYYNLNPDKVAQGLHKIRLTGNV